MTPDAFFSAISAAATYWLNVAAQGVEQLPVPYAFGAGMLASINPCGFVMLPAYAAFFVTGGDTTRSAPLPRLMRALALGGLVTLAFIGTFSVAGAAIAAGGRGLMSLTPWIGAAVGVVLVALGALQLASRRALLQSLVGGVRVRRERTPRGAVMFGLGYAVVSLGCTLPAFLVVAGSVFIGNTNYLEAVGRFVQYGLGMGTVLTVVTVALTFGRAGASHTVGRLAPLAEVAGNVLLVLAGLYVTWYWMRFAGDI